MRSPSAHPNLYDQLIETAEAARYSELSDILASLRRGALSGDDKGLLSCALYRILIHTQIDLQNIPLDLFLKLVRSAEYKKVIERALKQFEVWKMKAGENYEVIDRCHVRIASIESARQLLEDVLDEVSLDDSFELIQAPATSGTGFLIGLGGVERDDIRAA